MEFKRNVKVFYFQKSFVIIFLSILILSFQNCSEVPLRFISFSSDSAETTSDNNGQGYNGKVYYRYTPEFTCQQTEAPSASLEIVGSAVTVTENSQLLCNGNKKTLSTSDIDNSIYQNDVVGYLEGIYEGAAQYPQKIPANLVEVWCKDSNDERGIETLTYFDRNFNLAVNRTYYSVNGIKKIVPDFSVARTISNQTVLVRDANGFELTVYRDQPAPQFGLFKANLTAIIEGKSVSRETYCRLGGTLDPKIWPAKQLIDMNINFLKVSPQLDSVAYTSRNQSSTGYELFVSKIDGTKAIRVSKAMMGAGITIGFANFHFTADGKSLIYSGDERIANIMELFRVDIDGTKHIQLSPASMATAGGVMPDFEISNDGATVYFHNKKSANYSSTLMGTSLLALSPSVWTISPPTVYYSTTSGLKPTGGVFNFSVSKNQPKVSFSFLDGGGSQFSFIYIANNDGTELVKYSPPAPYTKWVAGGIHSINSVDYLIGSATGAVDNPGFMQEVVIPLSSGSEVIHTPSQLSAQITSANGVYKLLTDPDPSISANMYFFNTTTGKLISLPATYRLISPFVIDGYFSKDANSFITQTLASDNKYRAISIATADGTITNICPVLTAANMRINELDGNNFLILNYNNTEKILDIYLKKPQEECRLVNRVPSPDHSMVNARMLDISPDKQNVLIYLHNNADGFDGRFKGSHLYSVPLNGLSPVLINAPLSANQFVTMARFLKDSKSVIYQGDQMVPGQLNLFSIKIP